MQDRKRETADALQNVGGDSRFYGLVWNINKPTIDELSSEGIT